MPALAVLSSILPTALVFAVMLRLRGPAALVPLVAISWLIGQVAVTALAYLISCALVPVVSPTLQAAHLVVLALEAIVAVVLCIRHRRDFGPMLREIRSAFYSDAPWLQVVSLAAALFFSHALFEWHFFLDGNVLYRSKIYWDITAHYPIIQNFVFGDNFPAVDETAAGIPLIYHFFGDLQVAQYVSLGASLPGALLWVSTLSLAALMLLAQRLAEEVCKSRAAGVAAALIIISASNLRWLAEFFSPPPESSVFAPFTRAVSPMSYSAPLYPFGSFNVSMFNLFYFVEERHLIFSCALVALTAYLGRDRRPMSDAAALIAGVLLALFCGWNIFILPILGLLLLPRLFNPQLRRSALIMIAVMGTINLAHVAHANAVISASPWFDSAAAYPKLNFGFAAPKVDSPVTLGRFLGYYAFSIGPMLLCVAAGGVMLWRRARPDFWLLVPAIVVTFVLINTVQPMSTSVYENHKWVKPWQALCAVVAAAPISALIGRASLLPRAGGALLLVLLTLPGIPEAVPFFNRGSKARLAEYPSRFIGLIWDKTAPQEVFATQNPREILLAGRKIYYLNNDNLGGTIPHLRGLRFKFPQRLTSQLQLYAVMKAEDFCSTAQQLGVHVVEFSPQQQWLPVYSKVKHWELFSATPEGEQGRFSYVSTRECAAAE